MKLHNGLLGLITTMILAGGLSTVPLLFFGISLKWYMSALLGAVVGLSYLSLTKIFFKHTKYKLLNEIIFYQEMDLPDTLYIKSDVLAKRANRISWMERNFK